MVDHLLREPQVDDTRLNILVGIVRALRNDDSMRSLLNQHLTQQDRLSVAGRRLLLLAIAKSGVTDVPANWKRALVVAIHTRPIEVQLAALQAAEHLSLQEISADIRSATSESASVALRLAALRTLVVLRQKLAGEEFEYLLSKLSPESDIQVR